jgi:hypothetical protein
MAELEISKHTKKAYKVWNSKTHTWKDKLKEFFIEIFIIIFAVTVSIWFHGISEKKHDRKEVKNFLVGLQGDLEKDLKEMQEDTMSFGVQKRFLKYLHSITPIDTISTKRLLEDDWIFQNTTALVPNISRFEALKYSGLMQKVENKLLLDEILNLYEEEIPKVVKLAENASKEKIENIGKMLDATFYSRDKKPSILLNLIKTNPHFVYSLEKSAYNCSYVYYQYKEVFKQYHKVDSLVTVELKGL